MKHKITTVFLLLLSFASFGQLSNGGGEHVFQAGPCLTDADRATIQLQLDVQISDLRAAGLLPESTERSALVGFDWPVKSADERFYNVDGISNYVDQNIGSGILDYNCGSRSYNGHKGTDIYTWPFSLYQMDNEVAEIVAAAAGTIIFKQDGNYDRQCAWGPGLSWNAVYVMHSDGSIAWYGHMKDGSLTSKSVGQTVAAGEYLGVVGSSGFSTGPHLHFEIYDASGSLIDPYSGGCNTLNGSSWWNDQEAYRNSRLNILSTHDALPGFASCPTTSTPNFEDQFYLGDVIYTIMYLRDQEPGQVASWKIYQGDGSLWKSFTNTFAATYSSSWWWWSHGTATSDIPGNWRVEVTYEGEVYTHDFKVCASTADCPCFAPIGLSVDNITANSGLFSWQPDVNSVGFQMSGGKAGGPSGTKITSSPSQLIPVLDPASTYTWKVRGMCDDGSISPFSTTHTFSTPPAPLVGSGSAAKDNSNGLFGAGQFALSVSPNPASSFIELNQVADQLYLYNMQGALVSEAASTNRMELGRLGPLVNGIFLLEVVIAEKTYFEKVLIDHR